MTEFALRVGTERYLGWTSLSLSMSIDQLAHSFNAQLSDHWTDEGGVVPIQSGDPCKVLVDGAPVATGYIDEDSVAYAANRRSLAFTGRSKTGDLVDCAAVYQKGQWKNKGLLQIAKDICEPFGIDVSTTVDLGKNFTNPDFRLQEGETAFDAISRGARMRGVLPLTNGDGDLYFARAGEVRVATVLEYGRNIISGRVSRSLANRFSTYTAKTQGTGTNERYGRALAIKATATDSKVSRYRPTILLADAEDGETELQKRVDWERNVRAGASASASYTVQGWFHRDGLWQPNSLVRVVDEVAGLNDELLITGVRLSRDSGGTKAALSLTFKEAFDVEPLPTTGGLR